MHPVLTGELIKPGFPTSTRNEVSRPSWLLSPIVCMPNSQKAVLVHMISDMLFPFLIITRNVIANVMKQPKVPKQSFVCFPLSGIASLRSQWHNRIVRALPKLEAEYEPRFKSINYLSEREQYTNWVIWKITQECLLNHIKSNRTGELAIRILNFSGKKCRPFPYFIKRRHYSGKEIAELYNAFGMG